MRRACLVGASIAGALVLGCGGARSGEPTTPETDEPDTGSAVSAPEPDRSTYGYADSPITGLATDITDIAFAALRGQPLPRNGVAIERIDPDRPLVQLREGEGFSPERLEVLALGMELELMLGPEEEQGQEVSDAGPNEATLRTVIYLGATGLRLAELDVGSPHLGRPLPERWSGVAEVANDLLDGLRQDAVQQLLVGEAERQHLDDEDLWREVAHELPGPDTIARAAELARANPGPPRGYGVDDVAILVRDANGVIHAIQLQLEHDSEGSIELDSRPLARVRRAVRD